MRLTVGPLPPAVYWRRRALLLGIVLLVLFLVAQACMAANASPDGQEGTGAAAGSTDPPSGGPSSPSTDPSDAPTTGPASPGPDGGAANGSDAQRCTDDEMLITAVAEPATAPAGSEIRFTIRIRNDSDRTCRRDVGGGQRELFLRSGSGATTVWSSRHCADLTDENVRELAPGFATEHWVVWNGLASNRCDDRGRPAGDQQRAGEYELVARLGTAHSEPVTVTLT